MRYCLIILFIFSLNCGGGGSSDSSNNTDPTAPAPTLPNPPEIVSVVYYEWHDYASNPNPTSLIRFNVGDLVVWEVCATVDISETSRLEFALYWPSPFNGQPTYFFDYGPFQHNGDFMCFTNFDSSVGPLQAAWLVESPTGNWLLGWRVLDSLGQESFPLEEIYRINP